MTTEYQLRRLLFESIELGRRTAFNAWWIGFLTGIVIGYLLGIAE